jgi:toxin ParE1/3/4
MARYWLSRPAKADIAALLRTSEARHGKEARIRYRGLLSAAMRRVAVQPHGPTTADQGEILDGLRSFHIRHSRNESKDDQVGDPVHVIFYRPVEPGLVEIVRVLHERMKPSRHVSSALNREA